MKEKKLFLRWALLNVLALVFIIALAVTYGGNVHGPSLAVIPVIIAITAIASTFAGILCWNAPPARPGSLNARSILHDAKYLLFWAWVSPMIGILGTVFGFWRLLTGGGTDADLHQRIQAGGGVALVGTFVGVFSSILLTATHRMIEHDFDH